MHTLLAIDRPEKIGYNRSSTDSMEIQNGKSVVLNSDGHRSIRYILPHNNVPPSGLPGLRKFASPAYLAANEVQETMAGRRMDLPEVWN